MYEFTNCAKEALDYAKDFSLTYHYPYIGTQHILYGLMANENSLSSKILRKQGLTLEYIITHIVANDGKMNANIPEEKLDFTPKAKRIIQNSQNEAVRLKMSQVGSEHILISLLREIDSLGVKILLDSNIDIQKVFDDLIEISNENQCIYKEENIVVKSDEESYLAKYSKDLSLKARNGMIETIIGREKETKELIEVLSRKNKNNPVIIGEPGVGKTALVENLALKIEKREVPENLVGMRIVSLDIALMLAGAKYRGEFEDRIKNSVLEATKCGNVILFIDEVHSIVGAGASEGTMDAANILKPILSQNDIQIIGATTFEEYRKYISKDTALSRRFQKVQIEEPTVDETINILNGIKERFETFHNVVITNEAITTAVKMSKRYITDRFLPDKAIDIIDQTCSNMKLDLLVKPERIKKLEDKFLKLEDKREDYLKQNDVSNALAVLEEQNKMKEKLGRAYTKWVKDSKVTIKKEDVERIVAQITKIPVAKLDEKEMSSLKYLSDNLKKSVIGQDEAIDKLSRAIKRSKAGLKDENKPIGSFLFLGPTGVGKTELSKALARNLFNDENNIIRLDMSEYMESHSVAKIIGAPPGYVGYEDGGQLTEKIRKNPYSIILLDEIEKAHPDVFNILLQMLDEGRLTDSNGTTTSFKDTVIIMTSNLGAQTVSETKTIGFISKDGNKEAKDIVMGELKRSVKPELLNRIDETIVFNKLNREDSKKIASILLDKLSTKLEEKNINATIDDSLLDYIVEEGFSNEYGARPLKRTITTKVEDLLADEIIDGNLNSGDSINIMYKENKVAIQYI